MCIVLLFPLFDHIFIVKTVLIREIYKSKVCDSVLNHVTINSRVDNVAHDVDCLHYLQPTVATIGQWYCPWRHW